MLSVGFATRGRDLCYMQAHYISDIIVQRISIASFFFLPFLPISDAHPINSTRPTDTVENVRH